MADLDDMYNKISVEQAVVQTDYSHVFAEKKVDSAMEQSPYQALSRVQDKIGQTDTAYTFMNGQSQGKYENTTLQRMNLPGVNSRIDMPEKASRVLAE